MEVRKTSVAEAHSDFKSYRKLKNLRNRDLADIAKARVQGELVLEAYGAETWLAWDDTG